MGFLKKVAAVVSAPVTVPLKVASNIADNVGIGGPVSSLSSLAAAPFELLQKGASFGEVLEQAKPGLQILGGVAASGAGGAAIPGLGTGAIPGASLLNGLMSGTPSQIAANKGGGGAPQLPEQQVIYSGGGGSDYTMPLILGGGAILAIYLLRRK